MFTAGKIRPEKLTLEYLRSKEAEKDWENTKEWELLQNPTINLERAKRELLHVEDSLADRRTVLKEQRKNLDDQWKDLEKKELGLQKNFAFFNKFIKENKQKSLRATEKLNQSMELYEETKCKVDEIKIKLQAKQQTKAKMDEAIRKHNIYENFLHELIGPNYGFKTVDDILNRYESYTDAKNQLTVRLDYIMDQLEHARTNSMKTTEYYLNLMIGLHTKLVASRGRFENAVMKSRKWETVINNINNAIQEQFNHVQKVRNCIWEMYKDFCRKKNLPVQLRENDVEQQLLYIKKAIIELKRVRNRALKTLNANKNKN